MGFGGGAGGGVGAGGGAAAEGCGGDGASGAEGGVGGGVGWAVGRCGEVGLGAVLGGVGTNWSPFSRYFAFAWSAARLFRSLSRSSALSAFVGGRGTLARLG